MLESIQQRMLGGAGGRFAVIAGAAVSVAFVAIVSLAAAAQGTDWGLTLESVGGKVVVRNIDGVNLAWNFGIRPGQIITGIDGHDPGPYVDTNLEHTKQITALDSLGTLHQAKATDLPGSVTLILVLGASLFVGLGAIVCRWAAHASLGLTFLAFGWAVATTLVAIPAGTAGYPIGVLFAGSSAVIASSTFLVLFLIFPRPLRPTRAVAGLVGVITLGLVCTIAGFVSSDTPFPDTLDSLLWLWVAFGFAGGLALLGLRLRNPDDRQRLAPIVVGTAVGVAPLLLLNALPDVIGHTLILPAGVAALGLIGIPIGFTYAILRHRLFALDALMRGILLRIVDVVAFVAVFDVIWLPLRRVGVDGQVAGVVAVIGIAVLAPTISPWLRDQIDRLLYASVFEARRNAAPSEQQAVRDVALALVRQVRQLVPVQWVALVGRGAALGPRPHGDDAPPTVLLAADGEVPMQRLHGRWVDDRLAFTEPDLLDTVVPIVIRGSVLCAFVLGRRLNDTPLNGLDVETIQILGKPAAAPLEAALLREAAEEERRFRDGLSVFARGLATAGSVEQVLQVTAAQSRHLLQGDAALVWLRGPTGALTLIAADGDNASQFATTDQPLPLAADDRSRGQPGDSFVVARERHLAHGPLETISRITYRIGDVGSGTAIGAVIRLGEDRPFSQEEERRAGEIADHADGAFRRAHAIAQAAEAETLRQITKVRSEFLDIVSHDLQNPLTVIRGFAELLEMRLGSANDTYVNNALKSIVEATSTCQRLIDDLLTSARIERGRLSLNRERVDAPSFLARLADAYRVLPDGHRIRVEDSDAVTLWADVARLEQMVGNLVTNALRYAESGPIVLRARSLSPHDACIEVRDQGKGIAPEDQTRIWDRFYRTASGQMRTARGAGVGLSVVRTLAELHGGRAEVESTLGKGSTFRIILPVAEDLADDTPATRPAREGDNFVSIPR